MGQNIFQEKEISEKLVNTYTECIETDDDGYLDFDNTAYNFAEVIIDKFDSRRQKYYFKQVFDNVDDCYTWIKTHLLSLYELCEEFLENIST